MTYRLTRLTQMRVVVDDGRDLGRLMDLRTRAKLGRIERVESLSVDALLIGATGWLERMGLIHGSGRQVQPRAVIAVEEDRVIVRAAGVAAKSTQRAHAKRR